MTKSKANKRQQTELLGMSPSAAERKLRKAIIYELAQQLGKNICLECNQPISDPDDLAVVHVEDWEDGPSYFDLGNVAFAHASCRAGRHGRRQGERDMQRVRITVEDSKGRTLRGCNHKGQLYVAGKKDQRYQVRVKNRTNQRLCLVVTVDGRNVNTGERGSFDGSGFVLDPHQEWVFKGWRQSNDQVAAFRLGAKEDAYSSQMGSSENVGVIGVAVFEEKQPEHPIITVKETTYVPYPVTEWGGGTSGGGYGTFSSGGTWSMTNTTNGGVGLLGASMSDVQINSVQVNSSVDSSMSSSRVQVVPASSPASSSASSPRGSRRRKMRARSRKRAHTQQLGTEYGESLASKVHETTFVRDTDDPIELHLIRYDSLSALKRAGIMDDRGLEAPQAFPESPEVEQGFCAPPKRRRFT